MSAAAVQAKPLSLAWQFSLCLTGLAIFIMAIKRPQADASRYVSLGSGVDPMLNKQNSELQEFGPLSGPDTA